MQGELPALSQPVDELRTLLHWDSASPQPAAQVCQLPGCTSFCHPNESFDDWFGFYGRSHGRLYEQRRAAIELEQAAVRTGPSGSALARVVSGTGTTQISRSDGILCRGCDRSIRMGIPPWRCVCDEGFVHPMEACRARALVCGGRRHRAGGTPCGADCDGDGFGPAQQKHRRARARPAVGPTHDYGEVLPGRAQCPLKDDPSAAKMVRRGGCGRALHQRCADISKGYLH